MTAYAKRRDANEPLIVAALRAVGATVERLNGAGLCDLLVGYNGTNYLLECKNPDALGGSGKACGYKRTKGRGSLTPAQVTWFAAWRGAPVHEVINVDEALVAIGVRR